MRAEGAGVSSGGAEDVGFAVGEHADFESRLMKGAGCPLDCKNVWRGEGGVVMRDRWFHGPCGTAGRGQVWSWISYDVANQSFTLIVNTMLFSIFFAQVVVRDETTDDRWWALAYGGSMLAAAIGSPWIGAVADDRGWKKAGLIATGLLCGICTCGLAWIGPGQIALAMLLYVPANFAFAIGENFLASFLPSLASEEEVGELSGFSWGVAYVAAFLLLVVTAGGMSLFGWTGPDQWRPFFVVAGLWFLGFMVPTLLWLREPPVSPGRVLVAGRSWWSTGFARLIDICRHLRSHRDLAVLMAASFFFATGMSVMVSFASKLAGEYGFKEVQMVVFIAVITVSGVVGTLVPMRFQDRLGHRATSALLLALWIVAILGFAAYAHLYEAHREGGGGSDYPTWPLWVVGNVMGFGLGSLGAANRAFVAYLAPSGKSAETFGVWGLMIKLAAVMTFPFAWVKDTAGSPRALLLLALFLVVGLLLTWCVDEKRGRALAGGAS
ncbi:MAG: MFS transporter [Verrucomicrobia bacterium]|nr:MAG: MFS transporter [Verrucomicrobiota bacterium]